MRRILHNEFNLSRSVALSMGFWWMHLPVSDYKSIPEQIGQGLTKKLAESIAAVLALLCTTLLAKFGDRIFDEGQRLLGKRTLLQGASLLLIASGYLGWKVFKSRKLEIQLTAERSEHETAKAEVQRLKSENEERVHIWSAIEFRRGKRTFREWVAFCPKCHTPLAFRRYNEEVFCSANCGWTCEMRKPELDNFLNYLKKETGPK